MIDCTHYRERGGRGRRRMIDCTHYRERGVRERGG